MSKDKSVATPAIVYVDRATANRANSLLSTGPRTEEGKQRSSMNALSHGLTAASPVLPTEDRAAYDAHRQQFLDEYKPATASESQLVQELVDTSWRLNRIPLLEADALARALPPADPNIEVTFDIVDAHRILATLGLHSGRLSRQFNKALVQLREMQEDRRFIERRQLKEAADILIRHQRKGLPWNPADDGFVFSMETKSSATPATSSTIGRSSTTTTAAPQPSPCSPQPQCNPSDRRSSAFIGGQSFPTPSEQRGPSASE